MADAELDYDALDAERERIRAAHMRETPGPSTARGVHHVALLCSDVEQTVRFYQDLLEFPLTDMRSTLWCTEWKRQRNGTVCVSRCPQ